MTTLQITPNWKNKTARFKGTIAAGEHVAVSIANDDNYITDTTNLRLRVVNPANGKTLAQFPMPEILPTVALEDSSGSSGSSDSSDSSGEAWDSDLTPLSCTLNLNTAQMLMAVPPAANVPLLFVLDAYKEASDGDEGEFTLYFKDMCEVTHWPRRTGEEEPTNLDDYKDIIADFREDIYGEGGFKDRVENSERAAIAAADSARLAEEHAGNSESGAQAAMNAAQTAAANAANAKADAETAAGNSAQSALDAQTAQSGAEAAQSAAESAAVRAEAALPLDTTLSLVGKAADAKAVGDALALRADKSNTYTKSETDGKVAAEAQARTLLAATVQTNAATIATHTSSLASLASRVGDNETAIANRYTKSEVDAKVAGVQTFQKLVVNELPSAEAADDKTIYLVPRTGSETPDLCDEYVVVGAAGSRRWEKIGGGTVDLTNYYTKAETNAALAGKASKADATLTPIYSDTPTFSEWSFNPATDSDGHPYSATENGYEYTLFANGEVVAETENYKNATEVAWIIDQRVITTATRTRTDILGYQLGSQSDKPLASEAEVAANRSAIQTLNDTKLNKSGGEMSGSLTIDGSLTVGTRRSGSTVGTKSVAEGIIITASGDWSHAEGVGTTTRNDGEHAQGFFNVSHHVGPIPGEPDNTLSSIGFGITESDRKNAVETMQDGKTFIYGLGGYDGTNPTSATDLAGAVNAKANRAANPTAGNLAALDANGNPTDSTIPAANVATKAEVNDALDSANNAVVTANGANNKATQALAAIPYSLGTPIVIDTASPETVEGETVYYGAATLANRTANIVQVTAATALDELRITFPAATRGKVRDFGLRVEIGTGSAALAAPALVPIAPTGETIKIENNAAEIPALADGTATAKGVTLLYFSETAPGIFVVKGEQVEEVA